jgi:hypothetical protein
MHNWMRAEPIEVTIRRLAKYGYESIEISGEPEQWDTRQVRKLLDDYGLRCWGAVTLMLFVTSSNETLPRPRQMPASPIAGVKASSNPSGHNTQIACCSFSWPAERPLTLSGWIIFA